MMMTSSPKSTPSDPAEERIVRCSHVPNFVAFPRNVNISRTLFDSLQTHSSKVAFEEVSTGRTVTYEKLKLRAECLARRLVGQFNVRTGDVVAMFLQNSIDWVVVALATFRVGAILATFNNQLVVDEVKQHLELGDARFIFTSRSLAKIVLEAAEGTLLEKIFVVDGPVAGESAVNNLFFVDPSSDVIVDDSLAPLPSFADLDTSCSEDVTAALLFSSGTTGRQKAVMLSHRNLQHSLAVHNHPRYGTTSDPMLSFAPYFHILGFTFLWQSLLCGIRSLVMVKFDLRKYLENVEKHKVSLLVIVPPVAVMLVTNDQLVRNYDLSHVTDVMSGGAVLDSSIDDRLFSLFPNILRVGQGYGMTEACGAVTFTDKFAEPRYLRGAKRKCGSQGVVMYNSEMKVVDVKTGMSLGPNQDGELCYRSLSVMKGYYKNDQATRDTVDKDGWLHTGDYGHYDDDGYFYVVDRIKEFIKYNTYQVAPTEVEAVLLSHVDVADAAVVGVPDRATGELPAAFVVRKPSAKVTEKQLQQYVNGKVAPYKRLRGGIRFVSSIPKTASGKILRRILKEEILRGKL